MREWQIRKFFQEKGLGLGGTCYCPSCGHEVPHKRATPCYQVTCPKCGAKMDRKEE